MSTAYLNRKIDERAGLSDAATALLDKAAAANRDPSLEERAQLDGWETRCKALDAEISNLETQVRGNASFVKLAGRVREDEKAERRDADDRAERRDAVSTTSKSVGQRFVESDAFKAYNGRGSSAEVVFEHFLERREAITTDTVQAPAYIFSQTGYQATTPLLNAIGKVTVTSGSVEYLTWGASNAELVPEGELKPEATIDPTVHTLSLDTYAHFKAITRQALEDIAQVQSIVESKLRDGLANALEAAAATSLTSSTQIPEIVNDDLLAGIRQGIGEVQSHGYVPNAIVLNPADYATLDIDAAAGAGNGPVGWGSFWGVPAIASGAIDEGTVYVGDLRQGQTWFDRNTTAVYMSDSHADFFVRNMLVILAEQRAAFAVTEPLAIAKVTTTAETPEVARAAAKPAAK